MSDGLVQGVGGLYMITLTREEITEMELAMKARARMNGAGSKPHKICESILEKIRTSMPMPTSQIEHDDGDLLPMGAGKVAGPDSANWKEW